MRLGLLFALLGLLLVSCSKGQPEERASDLIVVPKDVANEDLSLLLPTDKLPSGFTLRTTGPAIKDGGNLDNIVPPSLYAVYADRADNRIILEVVVEAADATIARHARNYEVPVSLLSKGNAPLQCSNTARDDSRCLWKETSRIKAGDDSAAYESTTVVADHHSRVDFFVRSGVFASVQMDLMDDAAASSRRQLIEEFDRKVSAFVQVHGVPD